MSLNVSDVKVSDEERIRTNRVTSEIAFHRVRGWWSPQIHHHSSTVRSCDEWSRGRTQPQSYRVRSWWSPQNHQRLIFSMAKRLYLAITCSTSGCFLRCTAKFDPSGSDTENVSAQCWVRRWLHVHVSRIFACVLNSPDNHRIHLARQPHDLDTPIVRTQVNFGKLAETVLIFVDSRTREGRSSEMEELACDAGSSRSAQSL